MEGHIIKWTLLLAENMQSKIGDQMHYDHIYVMFSADT